MRFLVVDDSRAMQSIVRRGLKKAGYDDLDVKLASDGAEALEIIKVWEPDMVLTDWHMPTMSGMELLQAIRQQMLEVSVGMVTTETSPAKLDAARQAGAVFVINKPFADDDLISAVVSALQARVSTAHQRQSVRAATADNALQLPSSQNFAAIANKLSQQEILVEGIDAIRLEDNLMPCVLGLYEDEFRKSRAVIMMDLRAACILGAAVSGAEAQAARLAIAQQAVDNGLLQGCRQILLQAATVVSDSQTHNALRLRSVNLIPSAFPKLEQIYARTEINRTDFEVAVAGYGQGLMSIIAT